MSTFVNYQTRDIDLPKGCQDLVDVLQLTSREQAQPSGTMADIEPYVVRLFQSAAITKLLLIFNHQFSVNLGRNSKMPELVSMLFVDSATREQIVRALFRQWGIIPSHDALMSEDGVTSRFLIYPLPATASAATQLVSDLLRQVYGVTDDTGLNFCYSD